VRADETVRTILMARTQTTSRTRAIGFSTGSLALGDFAAALDSLRASDATAVELSALRESELPPLMRALRCARLDQFKHVAVHAPSSLSAYDELSLIEALKPALDLGYPVIVHADVIRAWPQWKRLGSFLYIENMDKRKSGGRTTAELRPLFAALPKARFCLDLAHARQIDPSLCEIVSLLAEFGTRLGQLHVSELNAHSRHEPPSHAAVAALRSVSRLIPRETPVILEFSAPPSELNNHLHLVQRILCPEPVLVRNVG
jgi:hypothetical protein